MANNSFFGLKVTHNPAAAGGTEKVSVNMNPATLSSIDLLVDNGYYSNRSDFINQAVRESLVRHQTTIDRIAEQNISSSAKSGSQWFLGVYWLSAEEASNILESGGNIAIKGYGVLRIDPECDPETLFKAVESIQVRGKVNAIAAVKEHYGLK